MSSMFGSSLKISLWGQSHSPAIGVTMDGLPAGFAIDMAELSVFLSRRAPGRSRLSSSRKEADMPEFLSGLVGSVTCGAPLSAIIYTSDARPGDYDALRDTPRPAHADLTAQIKYGGFQDASGGGHFSGRLTAPLCVAGGICMQLLRAHGITVTAEPVCIGGVTGSLEDMEAAIAAAAESGDSVGGIIRCVAEGVPAGLGEPMFDGLENRIAQAVFAIPAVKGIEFGSGFAGAALRGSENNDGFVAEAGQIRTRTNNHGGILGGISSGMPIVFRAAVKPTPSIAAEQDTVRFSDLSAVRLSVSGRHDPCIVPRAVPCVEAACAIVLCDELLGNGKISMR